MVKRIMNRTTNLFLLLIVALFIFPAAAIISAHTAGATVITNQPNAKTFKCIDPTGRKLLCILVVTTVKPPKNTLACKDPDNHKFKCTYIIISHHTNTKVFQKIVFLYVYVTPKHKKLLYENKSKVVFLFVTKIVVKVIHEHEYNGKVRVVVIREEDDNYRPTVVVINCFAPCYQQEYSRALFDNTVINAPVFITNLNQFTSIINNVNTINTANIVNNNLINHAYVNNVNTNNMNIFNPPPPPAYSPNRLFSLPPDTPIYEGGTTNPGAPPNMTPTPSTNATIPSNMTAATPSTNATIPSNMTAATPSTNATEFPLPSQNNTSSTQSNNTITPPPPASNGPSTSQNNTSSTQSNNTITPPPPASNGPSTPSNPQTPTQ
jgi:hypothetical protein